MIARCLAAAAALALGAAPPATVEGLWRYTLARCPGGDAVPQGYAHVLVIQNGEAAQESSVEGCASLTRGMAVRETPEGTVLRYTGGFSLCTPVPNCFGTFQLLVGGRVQAATYSCQTGATFGESAPLTLEGPDTLTTPIPGERGCVSVYTRVPGPGQVAP